MRWFCTIAFGLSALAALGQSVYYNTSSATPGLNQLKSVATNGAADTTLYTASGLVGRCTSAAVDGLSRKLFFVDGPSNAVWRVNLDGSGLTQVRAGLTAFAMDLVLDVLNQKIYFTTSSTVQSNNTVQVMDYDGGNLVKLLSATGGGLVTRCTAIALDSGGGKLFLADAGTGRIWSMNLNGSGLTSVASAPAGSFPTSLALDTEKKRIFFTAASTVQGLNSIQRVDYDGAGGAVFTASGSVQRCTAVDLDRSAGALYLSDAGGNAIWRVPYDGGSATLVINGLAATAKKVRVYGGPLTRPAPGLTGINIAGGAVQVTATNGFAGGSYYLLTSTNLSIPLHLWTPLSTNVLSASGAFTVTTSSGPATGASQQFYALEVE